MSDVTLRAKIIELKRKIVLNAETKPIVDELNKMLSETIKVKRCVYFINPIHMEDVRANNKKVHIAFNTKRTEYYSAPVIIEVLDPVYEYKVLYQMKGEEGDIRLSDDWYVTLDEWKSKHLYHDICTDAELYSPSKRLRKEQ